MGPCRPQPLDAARPTRTHSFQSMSDTTISRIDAFIRRDPAKRGLIGSESKFGPLCPGHLAEAAAQLAEFGRSVAIVTGFYIPGGNPPAAETDGPPGAVLLAQALQLIGIDSVIVTDGFCWSALLAAASASDFPIERLLRYPYSLGDFEAGGVWRREFFSTRPELSHLIAIERVGPSHTIDSLTSQPRPGDPPIEAFEGKVAIDHRDHSHNMRGEMIDEYAGDLHRLFEESASALPAIKTIGIGDGGNEIGMGAIPWEHLERRLAGEQSGRVPCRVPCGWNIVAGTSNWGAWALAAATLHLRGQADLLRAFSVEKQRWVLEQMVQHGPAVDGVTGRREATVDGIAFPEYVQPWEEMRRELGVDSVA